MVSFATVHCEILTGASACFVRSPHTDCVDTPPDWKRHTSLAEGVFESWASRASYFVDLACHSFVVGIVCASLDLLAEWGRRLWEAGVVGSVSWACYTSFVAVWIFTFLLNGISFLCGRHNLCLYRLACWGWPLLLGSSSGAKMSFPCVSYFVDSTLCASADLLHERGRWFLTAMLVSISDVILTFMRSFAWGLRLSVRYSMGCQQTLEEHRAFLRKLNVGGQVMKGLPIRLDSSHVC